MFPSVYPPKGPTDDTRPLQSDLVDKLMIFFSGKLNRYGFADWRRNKDLQEGYLAVRLPVGSCNSRDAFGADNVSEDYPALCVRIVGSGHKCISPRDYGSTRCIGQGSYRQQAFRFIFPSKYFQGSQKNNFFATKYYR